MTSVLAPAKNITLQGIAPDVIQSCVLVPPPPTPAPEPEDVIYAPVAPGITYGSLPVITTGTTPGNLVIVDTSPDQIIGCANDVGTDPQSRLNALFPSAVDGDGVVDRATNNIWVYDGATWNNVGPTPGPTLTVNSTIPPWNEILVYDARVRTRLEVNGLAYALALLTEPTAYGITPGMTVRSVTALVAVPTANVTLAAGLPAVIAENPIFVPTVNLTATANAPAISSGASVEVPSTSIALSGVIPAQVGTLNVIIAVPSQAIPANSHAPQVSTGASISIPASNANLTAYAPTVFDDDAWTYILAVESADAQALEDGVRIAINTFVVGCKSDGIWSAIKCSCILAGARTRLGSLTPLVGPAPTSLNFVNGDYDRETGLIGNGTSKYINSNRSNSTDTQNNKHVAIYVSTLPGTSGRPMLGLNRLNTEGPGTTLIYNTLTRLHDDSSSAYTAATGFIGMSRSSSSEYTRRNNSSNATITQTSAAPVSRNIVLFADNLQNAPVYSNARLAFYSIGESLNLALLDARVAQLISDIGAAI